MPKGIFEQSPVTLNGYDVSCDIESLEVMLGRREPVNMTGLCSIWEENLTPNIRRWGVRLNYFVNFDASSSGASIITGISTVLQVVFNSTQSSGVPLLIRASTGARGPTNPEWSGLIGIDGDFTVHGGTVAEGKKGSISLKGMGVLSILTSSS
jgi:hypothetical protein